MMTRDEKLLQKAQAFADQKQLRIGKQLGLGIHGIVFVAESKMKPLRSAIKIHREREPYLRELGVYERLATRAVTEIEGFHVPQLLSFDDNLYAIEMTIVTRPYVLDFAGAYLDRAPEFPDNVWAEWEDEKREQFGPRWPVVESIRQTLRSYGVYLLDVNQNNITFL